MPIVARRIPKRRNYAATESTLINIRAMKKRVAELARRVTALEAAARRPKAR